MAGMGGRIVALVFFFAVSLWAALMLTDVYMVNGRRHTRYKYAVYWILGARHSAILSVAQHANMILTTIGYQIAAADSMSYIAKRVCAANGTPLGSCFSDQMMMTIIFGGVQVLMSQLPNLEAAWWASAIGAVMSIGYSVIAIALGAQEAHNGLGSLGGKPAPPSDKLFGIFNALGSFGFAYSCAIVLMEVQDTLREPPAASKSMKKTVPLALSTTFILYVVVSVCGYAALGEDVPASIVLGFDSAPVWVTLLANFMVLVHMVPAYQVYGQPVFATVEDLMLRVVPKLDNLAGKEWLLRLGYRSFYVVITTVVACALPFFGAFVGLVGALTFWPTAIYYPMTMFKAVYKPTGAKLWTMNAVNSIMCLVAVLATIGSVETIVSSARHFTPFAGAGSPHGR
ncbi:transmembrane amino acid transporter protein-domain-containing protein [Scenedesmus sp. NREL 46B-D3]|nr:transmembrane amino acid transporter protein-domain-containing protein [Scenedesmus sp. NREL 46B-D3]